MGRRILKLHLYTRNSSRCFGCALCSWSWVPPLVNANKDMFLPHNTVTRTVTNAITATQCLTRDTFVTRTVEVIGQQSVIVTLCTKNIVTETVRQPIITPVNDQLVVSTITQALRPITSFVTDVSTNIALRTVTDTAVGTLTHRSNAIVSITQTQTQTQTLTQTTLVVSTQVNNRIVTVTVGQTVVNTIFVDAPLAAPAIAAAPAFNQGGSFNQAAQGQGGSFNQAAAGGFSSGQVFGFGGEAQSQGGAFNQGSQGGPFNQGGAFNQGSANLQGQAQGQGAFNQGSQGGFLQGQAQGQGAFGNQGGFLQGHARGQGGFNQGNRGGFIQGQAQGQGSFNQGGFQNYN